MTRTPAEQRALEAAALRNEDVPSFARTTAETHAPIDDDLVMWQSMVAIFLAWSEQPQASAKELEPHWTAGLLPIQAAARIIEERRGTACDDVE